MTVRRAIEKCLQEKLLAQGWLHQRVEDLPKAFVRDAILTPYFWPSVKGRRAGWYAIDGHVGMLDRDFERAWKASHPLARNHFPVLMFTANFEEIGLDCSAVGPTDIEAGVARYVAAFESFMSRWPRTRQELCRAFDEGTLMGKNIESFGMIYDTPDSLVLSPKFSEFRAFLGRSH